MTKAQKQLENLANATPEFLVDEIGRIRDEKKELEAQEGFYKTALMARVEDETEFAGEVYQATITASERTSLDVKAIREEMGEDWCEKRSRTTSYNTLRTKKL